MRKICSRDIWPPKTFRPWTFGPRDISSPDISSSYSSLTDILLPEITPRPFHYKNFPSHNLSLEGISLGENLSQVGISANFIPITRKSFSWLFRPKTISATDISHPLHFEFGQFIRSLFLLHDASLSDIFCLKFNYFIRSNFNYILITIKNCI